MLLGFSGVSARRHARAMCCWNVDRHRRELERQPQNVTAERHPISGRLGSPAAKYAELTWRACSIGGGGAATVPVAGKD
jgi:hypothetical protein